MTAALVAITLVLSVLGPVGTVAAAPGVDVTQTPSATVAPGETVEVTTTVNVDDINSASAAIDVDLPVGWEIVDYTSDAAAYRSSEYQWIWFANSVSGDKAVTYTVVVPDDATAGTYTVSGTGSGYTTEQLTTTATTTITVEDEGTDEATDPATFQVSNLDAPSSVTQGDSVAVSATVENTGESEGTQTVEFRIDLDGDGTPETSGVNESVSLAAGANETVSFEVPTSNVEPGTYTHGVYTDNDSATANLTVEAGDMYYSVSNLSVPANVVQGEMMTVNATVTNTGEDDGWQRVKYKIDLNDDGTLQATAVNEVVTLAPGESETVSLEVPTDDIEPGTYTHGVYSYQETATANLTVEAANTSEPAVVFDDQPPNGANVSVTSVTVPEGGFVAIHNGTDDGVGAVIGVSGYLEAGIHEDVEVTLFDVGGANFGENAMLEENETLIAMPHLDTNGNETYDFASSDGEADGPYTANGITVTDSASISTETTDDSGGDDSRGNSSGGGDDGNDSSDSDNDSSDDEDSSDSDNDSSDGGDSTPTATATPTDATTETESPETETATETETPAAADPTTTAVTESGPVDATETTTPGFGVVLALVALLGAALLARRKN